MSKKETKIILFGLFHLAVTVLHADISVALLERVESNEKMRMLYRNIPFPCEPFGIIGLEKMVSQAPQPQACKQEIESFWRSHPSQRKYALLHLHPRQSYHFQLIPGGCVLYANGPESYSEMLLREGLAVRDPAFRNPEWDAKLQRAQTAAEKLKKGLYGTSIRSLCIKDEE
ncbi:MAG: hypothetical protein AB1763_05205 [Campylobacterota bacterium]